MSITKEKVLERLGLSPKRKDEGTPDGGNESIAKSFFEDGEGDTGEKGYKEGEDVFNMTGFDKGAVDDMFKDGGSEYATDIPDPQNGEVGGKVVSEKVNVKVIPKKSKKPRGGDRYVPASIPTKIIFITIDSLLSALLAAIAGGDEKDYDIDEDDLNDLQPFLDAILPKVFEGSNPTVLFFTLYSLIKFKSAIIRIISSLDINIVDKIKRRKNADG